MAARRRRRNRARSYRRSSSARQVAYHTAPVGRGRPPRRATWRHRVAAVGMGRSLGCMGLQPSCGPRGSASSKYERFVRVAARCHNRAPAAVACSGGASGASAAASHEWLCGGAARSLSGQRLWRGRQFLKAACSSIPGSDGVPNGPWSKDPEHVDHMTHGPLLSVRRSMQLQ